MSVGTRANAILLAHHLYDFAECEHRIALDATLDRAERTPPDAATELLFEHGRRFERSVTEPLGYPAVEVEDGDWDGAAARTVALMREGVVGIDQGVLVAPGRLARPDLLERVQGASALGDFYYVRGTSKSALAPRSDAALQVGFAALLLEVVQGVRPATGFLILGDGRRETIDLEAIRATLDDAVSRAEGVARGEVATFPFFGAACPRCRWRGRCLPALSAARDVSFVHGLTRTRHRVLRDRGVATIDALARAELPALVAAGAPADGLERAQAQARALLEGRPLGRRAVTVPHGVRGELYLRIEIDPLEGAAPFLIAWAEGPRGGGPLTTREVRVVTGSVERADAARGLFDVVEHARVSDEPIYAFGARTSRGLEALCEAMGLTPARAGDLLGRVVDLAPWVRRAGVLPVFATGFSEVASVAAASPPPIDASDDDLFVLHAGLASAPDPDAALARLYAAGSDALDSLAAIRAWLVAPRAGGER